MNQWKKHKIWERSHYPFRIPFGKDENDRQQYQEIYFDVTLSAPSFDEPGKLMVSVFNQVLEDIKKQKLTVLDFGAGKLRNSLYFLEKGHNVYAVEFEELRESEQAKRLFENLEQYENRFKLYIFPHEFIADQTKFDLVTIINVLTIMPIPAERWLVLLYLHKRLSENGYLLWYSQFGDKDQRKRCTEENSFGDGYYIGKNRKFKTFYREYRVEEIDAMLLSCGFDFFKSYQVNGSQARLYKKRKNAPFTKVLNKTKLESLHLIDPFMKIPESTSPRILISGDGEDPENPKEYKICSPNPVELSFEYLLIDLLGKIKPGNSKSNANNYETVIALILSRVFQEHLRNLKTQQVINEGRKRIDFVMTNYSEKGFFKNLSEKHGLKSAYIIFECKNYNEDLENKEIDQLLGRLKSSIGVVGFIICRNVNDKYKTLKLQQDAYPEKLIIILTDDDIINLINFYLNSDENGLNDYLDDKAKEVIFKQ